MKAGRLKRIGRFAVMIVGFVPDVGGWEAGAGAVNACGMGEDSPLPAGQNFWDV